MPNRLWNMVGKNNVLINLQETSNLHRNYHNFHVSARVKLLSSIEWNFLDLLQRTAKRSIVFYTSFSKRSLLGRTSMRTTRKQKNLSRRSIKEEGFLGTLLHPVTRSLMNEPKLALWVRVGLVGIARTAAGYAALIGRASRRVCRSFAKRSAHIHSGYP